ncbi:MAG: carboxypeptidase regulatory-like domain-containing protein [Acidobacteria bacterium]|nr:carboxypeptidase regulatory-like domain-containing protein [Acidobacteriota bacterium]
MKRIGTVLAVVLLLLCGLALAAEKDPPTRSVEGVVTSVDDQPVSGAVVQLENTKTQQIRSYITQEDGKYRFYELSTEVDYRLKAEFKGASSATKTLSSFDSRKKSFINFKLNK